MATKTIDPFFNVPKRGLPVNDEIKSLSKVQQIQAGSGSRAFKADSQGIWLGSNKYEDAVFRVGMDGTIYIKSTSGGYILIDGPNQRLIVNDGADDRVLIGNLA